MCTVRTKSNLSRVDFGAKTNVIDSYRKQQSVSVRKARSRVQVIREAILHHRDALTMVKTYSQGYCGHCNNIRTSQMKGLPSKNEFGHIG